MSCKEHHESYKSIISIQLTTSKKEIPTIGAKSRLQYERCIGVESAKKKLYPSLIAKNLAGKKEPRVVSVIS
jgi:hypothetical protein